MSDKHYQVITIITIFVEITLVLISPLLQYAQVNAQPQSLVINSTMITRAVSSTTHFVTSPKSNIVSYEIMPPHSLKVSSYSNSSGVLPSIQIPSFTTTNASLAISYNTMNGISISSIIQQPVIKVSKGTLSADRSNVNNPSVR